VATREAPLLPEPYSHGKKKKKKSVASNAPDTEGKALKGYISATQATITQSPTATQYVNPNYERGDNVASISAIKETITANTNTSGSLLYFVNEPEPVSSAYQRRYQSTTDGTRGGTIIIDTGFIFQYRQVFLDFKGNTAGTPTIDVTFSHSQDGTNYTTIGSQNVPINTDLVYNIIGDYIFARFFKIVIALNIGASQDANVVLGKIRLII